MVSVAICTRNRAGPLRALLDSACALRIPPGLSWELLVVDNGSDDDTAGVVHAYAGRLPLRRVDEPKAGLSHARNRAVGEARGRYICWTDDDVLLDPGWLAAYVDAFGRHPEAAIFGGRIFPELEQPAPAWCESNKDFWPLSCVFARRDMGDEVRPIRVAEGTPWGANFAVRAREQQLFPYDPALGLSPDHGRVGEETDVIHRILAAGGTGWWVPESKVRHVIAGPRQTREQVFRHFRRAGATAAYLGADSEMRPPLPLGALIAGHHFLSVAARLAGLTRLSLRFLAGQGYYRGIAG
jgi:glycosyltransferase involved in cell wall biosynthesis